VRKTPIWPRSLPTSAFYSCISNFCTGMRGTNWGLLGLTPCSPHRGEQLYSQRNAWADLDWANPTPFALQQIAGASDRTSISLVSDEFSME
jgi:hypothetical protein